MAKLLRKKTKQTDTTQQSRAWVLRLVGTGAGIGVVVWLVTLLIAKRIIEPIFCQSPDQFIVCANGGAIASNVAILIGSTLGLIVLSRYAVLRPVLIVIASAVTMWGVGTAVGPLFWLEALVWTVLLLAISYLAYGWIAKLRSGPVAIVLIIVVIILARIVTTL